MREGVTAGRRREHELRAERDGRLVRLSDYLDDGDQVVVDGEPIDSGRVIVMRADREPLTTSMALVDELRGALSPDRVRDAASELSLYRHDASHMEGAAAVVCFPLTTAEVADVRAASPSATACRSSPGARVPDWPAARCRRTGRW